MLFQYPGLTITWSMSTVNSFAYDFGRGSPARRLGIFFFGSKATLLRITVRMKSYRKASYLIRHRPPRQRRHSLVAWSRIRVD